MRRFHAAHAFCHVIFGVALAHGCLLGCQPRATLAPFECVRAEAYGALSDDNKDDRFALQGAIDAAIRGPGCLVLGPGVYHAARRPEKGGQAIPSLTIRGPLRLIGEDATLAMIGSGIRPGETAPADWVLLQVEGASDVLISGIVFDGSQRTNTGEQTHLVQLAGPTERVVVERSTFNLPGLDAGLEAGDCVRLLGRLDAETGEVLGVRDTVLRDLRAPECFRSFLGIQRHVHGLLVDRVETVRVGDQAIDSEPTGGGPRLGCQPIASGITIRNSMLRRSVDRGITVTVAGDGCSVMDDVLIEDSVIEDGGIDLMNVGTVTLSRLHVESARAETSQPALLVRKRGVVVVKDSTLVRRGGLPSPVVQISAQGDASPTAAVLSHVTIGQYTARPAIRTDALGSLLVRESRLYYDGPGPAQWAVSATSTGSVALADTVLAGPWRAASQPATQAVLVRVEEEP